MDLLSTEEFAKFVKIHSKFRRKIAYMALSNQSDDDLVKDLNSEINKFNFVKDRVKFDFEKLDVSISDVANEICLSTTGMKYTDVYNKIRGAVKRGYKISNQPSELIELICESYGWKPSDFIVVFKQDDI